MLRLAKQGLIEKTTQRGKYRVVDKDIAEIDIFNTTNKFLDIKYPFGLEKMIVTMPKSIFVIAGSPNAGKSASVPGRIRHH